MIVFKTFFKIVQKYKITIIIYTLLLIIFGVINTTNSNNQLFTNVKPDIIIVNRDENRGITKNFVKYMSDNCHVINIKDSDNKIDDAMFYREVNYIIYIPKGYRKSVLNGKDKTIDIKSTGDYSANLAEIILTRYINIQKIYSNYVKDENMLINYINNNLKKKTNVLVTSEIGENTEKITSYFNFASYSMMAIIIYIICLIIFEFKKNKINERIMISSMNYKKHNRLLLFSSFIFAFFVFILYIFLCFIIFRNNIFNLKGCIYILNTLLFTFVSLTLALLIANIIKNKNAITGIVNVVALASSFLCGAFVPVLYLPSYVINIAHLFPSYWYIKSNNLLANIDIINFNNIKSLILNFSILLLFSLLFIILNNILSKRKI